MSYPQQPPGEWQQPPQSGPGFYPPMYQPPKPYNTMAIVAIVSAWAFAPLGIVFGHIALAQIRRTGEQGKVLAIIGLVIGYVATALIVITLVILVLFAVWASDSDRTHSPTTTRGGYAMVTPALRG